MESMITKLVSGTGLELDVILKELTVKLVKAMADSIPLMLV